MNITDNQNEIFDVVAQMKIDSVNVIGIIT